MRETVLHRDCGDGPSRMFFDSKGLLYAIEAKLPNVSGRRCLQFSPESALERAQTYAGVAAQVAHTNSVAKVTVDKLPGPL